MIACSARFFFVWLQMKNSCIYNKKWIKHCMNVKDIFISEKKFVIGFFYTINWINTQHIFFPYTHRNYNESNYFAVQETGLNLVQVGVSLLFEDKNAYLLRINATYPQAMHIKYPHVRINEFFLFLTKLFSCFN